MWLMKHRHQKYWNIIQFSKLFLYLFILLFICQFQLILETVSQFLSQEMLRSLLNPGSSGVLLTIYDFSFAFIFWTSCHYLCRGTSFISNEVWFDVPSAWSVHVCTICSSIQWMNIKSLSLYQVFIISKVYNYQNTLSLIISYFLQPHRVSIGSDFYQDTIL